MYEGHMQHDAQEFLRCLQCYLQDAEKGVQKFYSQLPQQMSPKMTMNAMMLEFLNHAKDVEHGAITDKKVSNMEQLCKKELNLVSVEELEAQKVKVNLFEKLHCDSKGMQKSDPACDPKLADTASVVDEIREKVSLASASLESNRGCSSAVTKTDDRSRDNTEETKVSVTGKRARDKSATRKGKVKKVCDGKRTQKPEAQTAAENKVNEQAHGKSQTFQTYSRKGKKRLGMRGGVVSKSAENLFDEMKKMDALHNHSKRLEDEMVVDSKSVERSENIAHESGSETDKNRCKSDSNIDSFRNVESQEIRSNMNGGNSFQNMFQAFIQSLGDSNEDSAQSDSDAEDIVVQKKRAKFLHESPRRSPRKYLSDCRQASPQKSGVLRNLFLSKSDTTVKSETKKMSYSVSPNCCESDAEEQMDSVNRNSESVSNKVGNCNRNETMNVKCDIKVESENKCPQTGPRNTFDKMSESSCTSGSTCSLHPVVRLENCDHVLSENGVSTSATFASQCLTPVKEEPRSDSSNYLKRRSVTTTEFSDTEEFKQALEEMFNSPVKSRSKFDMVERHFQVNVKKTIGILMYSLL